MKRFLILASLCLSAASLCSAQTLSLKLGAWSKLHYTTYDKKGNVTGFYRETVQERAVGGDSTVFTIRTTMFDESYVPIKSDNGRDFVLYSHITQTPDEIKKIVDLKKSIPQEFFDKGATITVEGSERGVPRNPSVGDLPDYAVKAHLGYQDMKLPIEVTCTQRRVEGQEKITTPAGTFDCWKFSSRNITLTGDHKDAALVESYYADGVGLVKMISYNLSGKIQSSVELQQAEIVQPK